jgi:hypothetical protein
MLLMLKFIITVDKEIINKRCYETVQIPQENVVNKLLESRWAVYQAKRHDLIFKYTISCVKCC